MEDKSIDFYPILNYLNPTDACHTNANNKNITGMAGIMSTIGRNAAYGSGKADSKKLMSIVKLTSILYKKTLKRLYNSLV